MVTNAPYSSLEKIPKMGSSILVIPNFFTPKETL
uniref:Uncharacterized protein n=1 Tax=Anguilla anguilla TaxID=7936 RepID=A0A0E9VR23_ANGAN